MNLIDLRSDTVTRPSEGMRKAMAYAEVGDDVYGEDPTVKRLEERSAELLGQQASLFVASGTQANQIALGVHCRPGDEVIAEAGNHCLNYEGGAVSALWGAQPRPIQGERGRITVEQLRAHIRPHNDHFSRSRVLAVENTHGRSGGSVFPVGELTALAAEAKNAGMLVHLDGARLFNAQVAANTPVKSWASLCDSATLCFSKGLGAPAGSVVAGSHAFVAEARRIRKRLGGGMRQVGILAAGCLYAIEHNLPLLAKDHENARRLARGLASLPGVKIDAGTVETNMVFADFDAGAAAVVPKLKAAGTLANAEGSRPTTIRFVCHLDVSTAQIDDALERIRRALS
jgi:threonine aldolase